jgi:hypothetical protein
LVKHPKNRNKENDGVSYSEIFDERDMELLLKLSRVDTKPSKEIKDKFRIEKVYEVKRRERVRKVVFKTYHSMLFSSKIQR